MRRADVTYVNYEVEEHTYVLGLGSAAKRGRVSGLV